MVKTLVLMLICCLAQLPFLLSILQLLVSEKWPAGDATAFKQLRDLLGCLFCGLRFNPSDKEGGDVSRRDFLGQLHAVELVVHLYLWVVRMEVRGGSDHCGLIKGSQEIKERWLKPLAEQAVEITDPFNNADPRVANSIVNFINK
ncbi:hypothetical protein SELMODRAFT_414109 [Selaginella moellendorffii]|uniref:Uncharacterized protein n=1 Tax=Selaginella moellendorffii TaxID=88036 RepID=D8RRN8_SELML|nr:hypothetical protein SELMODRAFT_414109 [Selaginella moellendorffii]